MRHEHWLLLYPAAWRARYGREFLATLEHRSLGIRDVIDVLFGALDAWLSTDVRNVTVSRLALNEGGLMTLKSLVSCKRGRMAVTPRDGLVGAVVMLVGAIVFKVLARTSTAAFPTASHVLTDLAFLGPFTLS